MLLCFFVSPKWNPTSTPQSFPISLTDSSHLLLSVWALCPPALEQVVHGSLHLCSVFWLLSASLVGHPVTHLQITHLQTIHLHHPPSNHWFFHLIYFRAPPLSCEIWYYASQLQNAIGLFKRFVSLSHYKCLALAMSDAFLFFNEEIE